MKHLSLIQPVRQLTRLAWFKPWVTPYAPRASDAVFWIIGEGDPAEWARAWAAAARGPQLAIDQTKRERHRNRVAGFITGPRARA